MAVEQCKTCRLYNSDDPLNEAKAECRRYPPEAVGTGHERPAARWPEVDGDTGWCGEWNAIVGGL